MARLTPPHAQTAHTHRRTPAIDGCQGCGACLLTCPETAIRPHGGSLVVLVDRCTGCGECIEVCPVDAISWKDGAA
jgi:ferredoxin